MELSKKQKRINYFAFLLVFLLQIIDNVFRDIHLRMAGVSLLKNGLLLFCLCLFGWEVYLLLQSGKKMIFTNETKSVVKLAILFLVLSLYYSVKNNGIHLITFEYLFRLLLPLFVAFVVLNVMSEDEIYNLMVAFLLISFGGYFLINIPDITLESIKSISVVKSYSPFESNFFSPTAMALTLYFCYYRKNKFYTSLSVFFTLMTFKRIMLLYSIFLLLCGGLSIVKKKVPSFIIRLFKVVFFLLTVLYILLMVGVIEDVIYKWFHITLAQFSMGRAWLMQRVLNSDYKSTGWATTLLEFRSMEMDLPQIYIEMGILAVIGTIHYITEIGRKNWYNFLIIIFCLGELLTSHWFDITYFWLVMYITLGSGGLGANSDKEEKRKVIFKWGKCRFI